eukprot:1181393-Prorocentrum_minimum.AAC.3
MSTQSVKRWVEYGLRLPQVLLSLLRNPPIYHSPPFRLLPETPSDFPRIPPDPLDPRLATIDMLGLVGKPNCVKTKCVNDGLSTRHHREGNRTMTLKRFWVVGHQASSGSITCSFGRTNQTQESWVYSHDGPIRCRSCGYILTMDQSDAGIMGIFS